MDDITRRLPCVTGGTTRSLGRVITEKGRILLREMTQDDLPDLCEILQDAETMYAYEHAFSDAEAQEWLDRQLIRYRQDGIGLWAVIDRMSGAFVGQCGLTWQDAGGVRELEIGYLLKRRFWHMGYATEAAALCRDYAFGVLNRTRVVSIIRDTNLSSRGVALRLGMRRERRFVKHYYGMDMPHDVYALERGGVDRTGQLRENPQEGLDF